MQLIVPDFICIGVQKAGTTWLYHQLIANPKISIPRKECNILTQPHGYLQSYTDFYSGQCEGRILGDVSPFYATQPITPTRIIQMNPECKVILLLRDPVSRAFSQYCMAVKAGRIPADVSLWQSFRQNLQFMKRRGCYVDILDELADAGIGQHRVLLLPFEWIGSDPAALLDRVYSFLGIEGKPQSALMSNSFAAATRGAQPPEKDARKIRTWYTSRNKRLAGRLWWQPDWI